jgi:hypothetical protein
MAVTNASNAEIAATLISSVRVLKRKRRPTFADCAMVIGLKAVANDLSREFKGFSGPVAATGGRGNLGGVELPPPFREDSNIFFAKNRRGCLTTVVVFAYNAHGSCLRRFCLIGAGHRCLFEVGS